MKGDVALGRARRRWRRATGADSLERAAERTSMVAVAVGEETRLMAELDHDLRTLEDVVLPIAERRTTRRA